MKRSIITTAAILLLSLIAATSYFLHTALTPRSFGDDYENVEFESMKYHYPHIATWIDSIKPKMSDTIITNAEGLRLFARYLKYDSVRSNTAIIIHGYKSNSISMLHIAYMFHHDLHYNVFLPDLQSHGRSEGDEIQMGWKDANDVAEWINVSNGIFGQNSNTVITGISMGGATTMMLSSKELPNNVKCFIEDCGYTSVWDEFKSELKKQYHLPPFPLLYTASIASKMIYGWGFREASSIECVKASNKPILFIHGDNDTYVPTEMVYPLYEAKTEPKDIYLSPGSAHADSYRDNPAAYTLKVREFLDKYCN